MAYVSEYQARIIIAGDVGASDSSVGQEILMTGAVLDVVYAQTNFAILTVQSHPDNGGNIEVTNANGFKIYLLPAQSTAISVNPETPIKIKVKGDNGDKVHVNEVL